MPNQKMLSPLILFTMLIPSLGFHLNFERQRYEVVFPRKILSVYKNNAGIQNIYPDLAHYELQLNGHRRVIRIEKSVGLFADNYTESHYKEDGTLVTSSSRYEDHCHYQGYIVDQNNSNVVLSTCKGLSGIIQIREKVFFIEPLKMTDTEAHAVYEAEDTLNHTCGVSNISLPKEKPTFKSWMKPTDAEKLYLWNAKKYVELYLVADKSMFTKYGNSIETVKSRLFEIVNYMNKVYKSINIYVALIGVEIWDSSDQFEVVPNIDKLLDGFKDWRINTLLPRKYHDAAQLLTNVDFEGFVIGYAPMNAMCSQSSVSINQDNFRAAAGVGVTMSHEMGHTLGMDHDEKGCICPDTSCIMSPGRGEHPRKFSSCNMLELRSFIFNYYPTCLLNVPALSDIQSPPVCGNMFIETGEDCDCGLPEECKNKCCDPYTCKLKPGNECTEGPCCRRCKFKHAGALCRRANDDCDLLDLCDGKSPTCKDSFRMNGYPCRNGEGACFNGECPNLSKQCADLWGRGATAAPSHCFDVNTKGILNGNCKTYGIDYIACEQKDKLCGFLYCIGGDTKPKEEGLVYTIGICKTLVYMYGRTLDGTKCGATDVCFNGKCSNVEDTYKTKDCAARCPGHSVCDHELECQCEPGWAPPNCTISVSLNQAIEEVSSLWWWLSVLWILALNI